MELPRYQISTNEDQTIFWFTSQGPKGNIIKIVIFTLMNEPSVYNLALGDFDPETNHIDFENVTNNSDRDKVLASVVDTVYAFFAHNPNVVLHFKGSDKTCLLYTSLADSLVLRNPLLRQAPKRYRAF